MLQALDSSGKDSDHLHSIVVKVDGDRDVFDIHKLSQILARTSMEDLWPELKLKYVHVYISRKHI